MPSRWIIGPTGAAALLAGCNAVFGVDDLAFDGTGAADGGSGGAPSAGGAGGDGPATTSSNGGFGGTGASGGGGSGGEAGSGGSGGSGGSPPDVLTDRGLVARYYFDQADAGQAPPAVLDSGPAPEVHLPILYAGDLQWTALGSGRGLSWPTGPTNGGANASIDGTKLFSELDGNTTATLELVIDAQGAMDDLAIVMMIMRAGDPGGRLGLTIADTTYPALELSDTTGGVPDTSAIWDVDIVSAGRSVVQVVVDTSASDVPDRAKLYVNGVRAPDLGNSPIMVTPIQQGEIVDLCNQCELNVGNRPAGDRFYGGVIFYGAFYDVALTEAEVQQNVAVLTVDDDAPN